MSPVKITESPSKADEKVKLFYHRPRNEKRFSQQQTALRFSPTAWSKFLFFRDAGETEIGGFGISPADDLLYIEDFLTVKEVVTSVSVSFDDSAVADFFETQVDLGRKPESFARIWLHTHPGNSPEPSGTDEATFERVFGKCDWAVMAILARGGPTYARLRFNIGPGGEILIPVEVDYSKAFAASSKEAWLEEYRANIRADDWCIVKAQSQSPAASPEDWPEDALEECEDSDIPWWWNY
jgi:proteasome lid subunit RPN8/RPN11